MLFHHLGVATDSIEQTILFIEQNFNIIKKTDIIFDTLQDANLCMLTTEEGTNIELVSGKTVQRFIKKQQFLYHTCWEVEDIEKSINSLYDSGALLISPAKEAILFNNRKVAFMHSALGIIELLEKEKDSV